MNKYLEKIAAELSASDKEQLHSNRNKGLLTLIPAAIGGGMASYGISDLQGKSNPKFMLGGLALAIPALAYAAHLGNDNRRIIGDKKFSLPEVEHAIRYGV